MNETINRQSSENLEYNTQRERIPMTEYGRNVLKMAEQLKAIPDKAKRSEQARAVVKTMELLNPSVRTQDEWEHKLWDHLYMIAGFDLDIDAPYAPPVAEEFSTSPVPVPMKGSRIKATHYGRNIEKMIDLVAGEPEGEMKNALLVSLATYMRTQYLIWNKDSVADETIFSDIEKLSDYRIRIPEGLSLKSLSQDANFSRPSLGIRPTNGGKNHSFKYGNRKGKKR